jgi:DNA-binding MarR family transcriptional regulator
MPAQADVPIGLRGVRSGYRAAMATDGLRDLEQEAWSGFLYTHDRLWRALAAGLAPLNVSMAEYSVLALLHAADPKGMRMSDLAQRRLMSTGGFTRLADRLVNRGLIERRRSAVDARSFDAILTSEGRALMRKARRQHHSDLRALFFGRLDDEQLRCLINIWACLDSTVDTSRGDDATSGSS